MAWLPFKKSGHPLEGFKREMDRVFEDFFSGWGARRGGGEFVPPVDVHETESDVVVTMEVPGLSATEIDISISSDVVTIRGEKKSEREEKGRNYHVLERSYGSFQRSVPLPAAVESDKAAASCKDGILTVSLPKAEKARARKIEIKL